MDYFADLGVRRGATKKQIKNAYKNLVLKFHPDKVKLFFFYEFHQF